MVQTTTHRLICYTKNCFLTAGEMYYGVYSDIFSSLPANCFIRKPVENEDFMKRRNEIIAEATIDIMPSFLEISMYWNKH
jgi:hypothetical protein